MTKFPLPFCDATEISNMAADGHSNTSAVGNNKIILSRTQNNFVIFTFKSLFQREHWLHSKAISEALPYDMLIQTPSFGWSFQDGQQLASKSAHPKQRVARSSPIFQIIIMQALSRPEVYVICRSRRLRRITQAESLIILNIMR